MSNNKTKSFFKLLSVLIVLAAAFHVWLFTAAPNSVKFAVLKALPYPMANIGGQFLLSPEFFGRFNQAKIYYHLNDPKLSDDEIAKITYNTLVKEKGLKALGAKYKIDNPGPQLVKNFIETQKDSKSFQDNARLYNFSEADYKRQIENEMLIGRLAANFYGQRDLHEAVYQQAESLLEEARQKNNFSQLAARFSQDKFSSTFGGHLGEVGLEKLLPELWPVVESMQPNELKLAPSREGLHILWLEGKSQDPATKAAQFKLSQIFFELKGFDNWLEDALKQISQKQYIKF